MIRKVISTEEDATSHEVVFPARHGQNSGQISTTINTLNKGRTTVLIPENSRKFSPGCYSNSTSQRWDLCDVPWCGMYQ